MFEVATEWPRILQFDAGEFPHRLPMIPQDDMTPTGKSDDGIWIVNSTAQSPLASLQKSLARSRFQSNTCK
jgi:hypothetical protein